LFTLARTCSNFDWLPEEDTLPIALTAEQLALPASIRERAKRAGPIGVIRSAEPPDGTAAGEARLLGLPREEAR
jgi:hypothetical protein